MRKKDLKLLQNHILTSNITDKDKEVINSLFFSWQEIYPDNIDYMIIMGNSNLYRIKVGVKLYHKRPCKMILTGGSLIKDDIKECNYFYKYALSKNVLKKDLICEENSQNTIENIRYSFNLIKKEKNTRLLIVSSTNHLYRIKKIVALISKQLKFYPECFYYPVYPKNYNKDNWHLSKTVMKDFYSEIDKIIHYQLLTD